MQPLVSVLTVTYNHEQFISECIDSILASNYSNFELIIVDDVSTDNTFNIAKEYEKKDNRVKVYRNTSNLGDYPNRNKAASYATGKYIKYVDGDDIIYPYCIETMVNAMEKYPNAGIGFSNFTKQWNIPFPIVLNSKESFNIHFFETPIFFQGPTASIIRRDIFESIGTFSGEKYLGDTELTLRIAAEYPIVVFQNNLIWWRIHPNQESKKQNMDPNMPNIRHMLNIHIIRTLKFQFDIGNMNAIQKIRKSYCRKLLGDLLFKKDRKFYYKVFKYSEYNFVDLVLALLNRG